MRHGPGPGEQSPKGPWRRGGFRGVGFRVLGFRVFKIQGLGLRV